MPNATILRCLAAGLTLLLAGGPAPARPADAPVPLVAVAAEVASEGHKTRLVVTLSRPVTARAAVMERPDRVIVDLPEVNFQLPADGAKARGGAIASFRFGQYAAGRSRIVVDLERPALVSRVESSVRADGAAILTLELVRTDRETFARQAAVDAAAAIPAPPTPIPDPKGDRRPVIVIDAGHGGIDPGARTAAGVHEKDLVLAFTERLRQRLESERRYRVVMTRSTDVFVPLGERVRIAQVARADLFISVHADSISNQPQVRGLTVYTGSERATDAESERLANRENQADAIAGHAAAETAGDVADILRDLTLRETRGFSNGFARKLVGELEPVMNLNSNPHREAGFVVLRAHDVPSVLVELGYLSSRKDIDLLQSEDWRAKSTAAMAAAIDRYFATRHAIGAGAPVSP
ncbi:N-acetylmuramoyl-L-alanine amidase [Salinarimonas soli]|uniref:N-acetylmuramoyl-L-alanine amidase n=1 Tax=Salinarimonas soli TaxID=1638099 RepID=A0A5B2VHX8_9HYPH|nr:N-acetylmuramoyl-L-alanine amidase [Salinarimonas soli]KAA2238156.1 N-acetylmuramoyl-L-alanine amidase [Salinarimonas soli]